MATTMLGKFMNERVSGSGSMLNHPYSIFLSVQAHIVVCNRNQVSVSGTKTKVQLWYRYRSRKFLFQNRNFFLLLGVIKVFTSLKLNKDLQNKTRKSLMFVSKFGFRGLYGGKNTP
jgi:hypothetical protein